MELLRLLSLDNLTPTTGLQVNGRRKMKRLKENDFIFNWKDEAAKDFN